jgi:predicted DNA-binding protein YlxM (UPF0122 family)
MFWYFTSFSKTDCVMSNESLNHGSLNDRSNAASLEGLKAVGETARGEMPLARREETALVQAGDAGNARGGLPAVAGGVVGGAAVGVGAGAGNGGAVVPRFGSALSDDQRAAMELLLSGKSVAESARTTGVSRATIYNWLKRDADFLACYNQWKDEIRESCQGRLMRLTEKATTAVQKAVEAGNARIAMDLLKGMGMVRPAKLGATDAEEVKKRLELKERRKVLRLEKAERRVSSDEDFAGLRRSR